jgi:hypothetical protein
VRHAPYYCEENVWWLAQEPRFSGLRSEVVFVSNERRTVAMRAQRAGPAGEAIVWDYHVVLAVRGTEGVEVWDLDCTEGAPISARAWLDASFDPHVPPQLAPRFRVMASETYVAAFASDRRHMRRADGSWQVPPPPWPVIGGGAHELEPLIDLADATHGAAIDLTALRSR